MNLHIKRPRMTKNSRIGSINKDHSHPHICEFADKKTAYSEVRLYFLYLVSYFVLKKSFVLILNTRKGTNQILRSA